MIWYYTILYSIKLYYTILYSTKLYIVYDTVLYYTVGLPLWLSW